MLLSDEQAYAFLKVRPDLYMDTFEYMADEVPLDLLQEQAYSGQLQVWRNDRAVVMAHVIEFPTSAIGVHVVAAQGEMEAVLEMIDHEVEPFAIYIDADWITVSGRKGWERVGRSRGYLLDEVVLKKRLPTDEDIP